jgi:hypothetical protein
MARKGVVFDFVLLKIENFNKNKIKNPLEF